ncbi:unnamed protein product [Lactuca saligna]|uniref:Uncharacterized protein n=1 Tax=Lactuca saligna TaxID=75948 RepID=A0AA35ZT53_LACSI|nr:unnamed protein product [Lactuca saligna]
MHLMQGQELQVDFTGFTYSPFNIRTESDDEAPVMRGQLKAIHEKLDSLLHASKPSPTDDYSQATINFLRETLTKHSANLERMKKAVNAFATVCNSTTKKVDKLISEATAFMEKFQTSFESNTAKANKVISSLGSSIKIEKAKLQVVCTGLKSNYDEFQS